MPDPHDPRFTKIFTEADHLLEHAPTCPYCGYVDLESEAPTEGGELECGHCGRPFSFRVERVAYYSTKRMDGVPCEPYPGDPLN
jgi:transcription elongation factor Elf1